MIKLLITGKDSYIGVSVENYLKENYPSEYEIDTLDMLDPAWREVSFSGYDAVFHVAGIAHSDSGKISDERAKLYYAVNTDLTVEVAKKAKADGVGQFIFMSSAIVYGESSPIGKAKHITKDTPPAPANCYGDSKLKAEEGILPLDCESFKVVVLRPPVIYGKGSKGNYPTLSSFARKMPIFPYVKNQRSMLYVEHLCEFVHLMLKNCESGIFHPQNKEYSNTSELVKLIGEVKGKKIILIRGFGWALKIMSVFAGIVNKAFGSLSYDMSLSEYKEEYRKYSLKESIERTEK